MALPLFLHGSPGVDACGGYGDRSHSVAHGTKFCITPGR